LKKRLLMAVILGFLITVPGISSAAKKLDNTKVLKALNSLGISNVKILGIQPAPIKNLYLVYVDLGRNGRRAFIITKDTKYIIVGRLLDVTGGGRDLAMERRPENCSSRAPLPFLFVERCIRDLSID